MSRTAGRRPTHWNPPVDRCSVKNLTLNTRIIFLGYEQEMDQSSPKLYFVDPSLRNFLVPVSKGSRRRLEAPRHNGRTSRRIKERGGSRGTTSAGRLLPATPLSTPPTSYRSNDTQGGRGPVKSLPDFSCPTLGRTTPHLVRRDISRNDPL